DRLRERHPRRRAADEPEPVPADVSLRSRDPRPARAPERALHPSRDVGRGATVRRLPELLAPSALVVATALIGLAVSVSLQTYFLDTLLKVSIVVALYVFIGNSGVLSFGHISFVALGVWTAGVLTVPESQKNAIMPGLAGFILHASVSNVPSLLFAAAV